MNKVFVIDGSSNDPYHNLGVERTLTETVEAGQVLLYLWQNAHTVVIGKNQNAWAECNIQKLEADGGLLARRPSGGGAVYHDLGNLNFSFIATHRDYDVARQLDVILLAMKRLGFDARRSGRNDLTIDERKFSGNAFSHVGERHCHHGTLMLSVDTEALGKYLTVSRSKLDSKGVASVRSRVCNLCEQMPGLTVEQVKAALLEAFSSVYGAPVLPWAADAQYTQKVAALRETYGSWAWKYGRSIPFTSELSHRFDWGELTIQFQVQAGQVRDVLCYSDALDIHLTEGLDQVLTDCRYTNECLSKAVFKHAQAKEDQRSACEAIAAYLSTAAL